MQETNNAQVAQFSLEYNRYGPRLASPRPQVGGCGAAHGALRGGGFGYGHPGAHQSYGYGHPGAGYRGYGAGHHGGFSGAGHHSQTAHGGVQQVYGGVQSVVQSPELIQARVKSQAMWADVNAKRGNSAAYSAAGHHGGYAGAHSVTGQGLPVNGYTGSASRFGGYGGAHAGFGGDGYGHPAMGHPGFGGFRAAPARAPARTEHLMNAVFIDCDGVLACYRSVCCIFEDDDDTLVHDAEQRDACIPLEKRCIRNLRTLTEAAGCGVVLSTTWRIDENQRNFLTDSLAAAGITVVDSTPDLGGQGRGFEIAAWLEQHPEINNFVVLDDDVERHGKGFEQGLPGADTHVVWTLMGKPHEVADAEDPGDSVEAGLTEQKVQQAIAILNDSALRIK